MKHENNRGSMRHNQESKIMAYASCFPAIVARYVLHE